MRLHTFANAVSTTWMLPHKLTLLFILQNPKANAPSSALLLPYEVQSTHLPQPGPQRSIHVLLSGSSMG